MNYADKLALLTKLATVMRENGFDNEFIGFVIAGALYEMSKDGDKK